MNDIEKMLDSYCLTTAEIIYHLPDHPHLLQSYIWQDYDLQPSFPELMKFLNFWEKKLDGKLHSVTVGSAELLKPATVINTTGNFTIH